MECKQKLWWFINVLATFLAFSGIEVVYQILQIIAEKIGASHWQVEMLFTAYILTIAIMMLPAGIFASRFGYKRMMTIGLAIVTIFAFICCISQTFSQLSLFRAGWGLGYEMFFATSMTLLIAFSKDVHDTV
ncbi:MFS transporter, partial [Bacillus sp. S1-R5C1-FB]|uniref:MFS transporter n=1 Tax=Bacillus sp. S1-R5C1-FB TaxID=1973491 RepID=UPI00115516B8